MASIPLHAVQSSTSAFARCLAFFAIILFFLPNPSYAEDLLSPLRNAIAKIQTAACIIRLNAAGIVVEAAEQPKASINACKVSSPVRLISAPIKNTGQIIFFPDRPVLNCAFAQSFAQFSTTLAEPLARASLQSAIVAIETGPGYDCRHRNRLAVGKISAHGAGLAADMRSLKLADGRNLFVGKSLGAEKLFLETLAKAACGFFSTVLGPGSDAMHQDHLHFDAETRSNKGGGHFCQP